MARISIKYPIGSKVATTHKNAVEGIITAIFIRGRNRAYEFSYTNNSGEPVSCTMEEVEIVPIESRKPLGFNK